LDDFETLLFQVSIQVGLLGDHRFALGDHPDVVAPQNLRYDCVGRPCIRCPVHTRPGLCGLGGEPLQIGRQVVEHLHPYGGSLFAQSAEVDALHGITAFGPDRVGGIAHGLAQGAILDGSGGIGPEIKTGLSLHSPSATSSAICLTLTLLPRFLRASAMFIRQPQSQPVTVSAPVAMMLCALSSAMAIDISGSLAMNIPPKPQQRAASGMGTNPAPFSASMSASGSSVTPRVRVRWQEEW